jgi:2-polyprenyl-3-methyl-5-hydroxy-6-metoxy-1,4-benzoquinol methylase
LQRRVFFSQSFAGDTSLTYAHYHMPEYVLSHHLKSEAKRLALMSELLDPMHRRHLQLLDVVKSGARTLEVGCGNGSISAWLARQFAPDGRAVAVDLDLSLIDVHQTWSWGRPISWPGQLSQGASTS